MNVRTLIVTSGLMVGVALLLFGVFQRQVSRFWLNLATHPEVRLMLDQAAEDQRHLAQLDPDRKHEYRARFEQIQKVRRNLLVLQHNREDLAQNYETILAALLSLLLATGLTWLWLTRRRTRRWLQALDEPLAQLARGDGAVFVADKQRGLFRAVADKIEATGRVLAKQQNQVRSLQHLQSWQEASRRHAHEIRTPLTAAVMEVERLRTLTEEPSDTWADELAATTASILEELDRLKRFTQGFTSFGKLRQPQSETLDLGAYLDDFQRLFAHGWDNMTLAFSPPAVAVNVNADPEMVRQVIVNLCNNSALAFEDSHGEIRFHLTQQAGETRLDVTDNGPGVAAHMVDHLFEPYRSTRGFGEGMGLGLAIARKIMLDHGGDLELSRNGPDGATFTLTFPNPKTNLEHA